MRGLMTWECKSGPICGEGNRDWKVGTGENEALVVAEN